MAAVPRCRFVCEKSCGCGDLWCGTIKWTERRVPLLFDVNVDESTCARNFIEISMTYDRLVIVNTQQYPQSLAVILKLGPESAKTARTVKVRHVMITCDDVIS